MEQFGIFLRKALLVCLSFALSACSLNHSQFVKTPSNVRFQPEKITSPESKILVIYNHGSRSESKSDPCYPSLLCPPGGLCMPGGVPPVVRSLVGKKIAGLPVIVYAFCSEIKSIIKYVNIPDSLKLKSRVREITQEIDRFTALGFRPEHIFLIGHSAGGWASLLIEATQPEKVNAVIAFSPAFAGKKKKRSKRWQRFREDEAHYLIQHKPIDALVYAFAKDPYNSLEDLSFFKKIQGVEYVPLPNDQQQSSLCYRGHRGAFKYCFKSTEKERIKRFITTSIRKKGSS